MRQTLYQKDPLTGLYNRRGFDKVLREKFMSNNGSNENYGIVSIDMDNLKVINDNYGHASGDVALKALADIISSIIDEGECAARIGGDEFSAVIRIQDTNAAAQFKERLQKGIDEYNAASGEFSIGASVGICEHFENMKATLFECMKIADMRMYEDKKSKKIKRSKTCHTKKVSQNV